MKTIVACRINVIVEMPKERCLKCTIHHKKIISSFCSCSCDNVPRVGERKGRDSSSLLPPTLGGKESGQVGDPIHRTVLPA